MVLLCCEFAFDAVLPFCAVVPPMRDVADRMPADMPEDEPPEAELAELVETTEEDEPEPVEPAVEEPVVPLDEPLPPVAPPPRRLLVKLDPSVRPPCPRAPRNWGVRSEEYFSGPV